MGGIFGGGAKKAAKKQAKAIKEAAELEAKQHREAARGAQMATETMLAQDRASKAAAELLKRPQEEVEVELASRGGDDEFDPVTGKRRTTRSTYTSAIQI